MIKTYNFIPSLISLKNDNSMSFRSAVLYSDIVDPIFQEGVTSDGTNLTVVIERFRFEIQHSILVEASISKGDEENRVFILPTPTSHG